MIGIIRITDVTLCTINSKTAPKEKLLELYLQLLKTGINFIEINIPACERLYENIDAGRTILRVRHPEEIKHYPGFIRYISRYSGFEIPSGTISEIQVNDIKEVNLMNRFSDYDNIRIVGLDDLLQHDYLQVFEKIKKINKGQIEFCPQNSFYCATALAVEWILSGGDNIAVSFFGSGGFAALEEVIIALRLTKRHKPNLDLSVLKEIKKSYEEITGTVIPENKAVIGDNIFNVESGIHVDGIFKNGSNYEPFEPAIVGRERKIIVGKHSGRTTMEIKLNEYGIDFPPERIPELLKNVQQESIRLRRSISDEEFILLVKEFIKQ